MTLSKRDKISPLSIFFLLYISRIVVSLTNAQSVTTGLMKTDFLISILGAMCLSLLAALPALFCLKNHKNPFDNKIVGAFYCVYFIFLAAINTARFSYFASTTLNPDSKAWMFSALIIVCACYGACMGIESIARFTSFAFILLVTAVFVALAFNIQNFEEINLYPVINNSKSSIAKNILLMTASSSEPVMFLCLNRKVNGKAVKPYVFSVIFSYLTLFLLIYFVIGVMGDYASLESFPVYSLFQYAKISVFERLDSLHASFWILGIFVKTVLLIYCASISFKGGNRVKKCMAVSILSFASAVAFTENTVIGSLPALVYTVPYLVFCIVTPVLTLMFKKRNYGDELVEKF